MWFNACLKMVVFSLVLWLGDQLAGPIAYPHPVPLFFTAGVLTLTGVIADRIIVPLLGNLPSTLLGIMGITAIIWGCAWLWPGVQVPLLYAFLLSLPMGGVEFLLHRYILPGTIP